MLMKLSTYSDSFLTDEPVLIPWPLPKNYPSDKLPSERVVMAALKATCPECSGHAVTGDYDPATKAVSNVQCWHLGCMWGHDETT